MTPLGFICAAPLVPVIVRRFGPAATALTAALSAALLLALIGWTRGLLPWFPLRFLLGVAVLPLYILSEVWIISLAPAARRGRIMGIYTSIISAGFAIGPFILIAVGTEGWPPFLVAIGAFLVCTCSLLVVLPRVPSLDDGGERASIRQFLPLAPVLLFAVFVTAVLEQVSLSLLPVYGLAHGIGEKEMSALIAMLVAGNVVLQVPIGLAAERWSSRAVLIACALATAFGCLLFPLLIETPLIWPLIFLWGAACFGIYTVALVAFGARFSGAMLVAGNAAFALMWGVGGIAGPSATGAVMDAIGVEGLPLMLGALSLVLLAVRLARR
jgi:MFS family permease